MALAVSMLDPPPTPTTASHGPLALACSIAAFMLSSVGSTCTPSNTWASMPNWAIWSATRCGVPVAATPGSVTTRARLTPYWLRSKPISSEAPGPNLSCGAPYVKTVSGFAGPVLADSVSARPVSQLSVSPLRVSPLRVSEDHGPSFRHMRGSPNPGPGTAHLISPYGLAGMV